MRIGCESEVEEVYNRAMALLREIGNTRAGKEVQGARDRALPWAVGVLGSHISMKPKQPNPAKELYRLLRNRTPAELWRSEVPAFDAASLDERLASVGLVRAVGVVFSESGTFSERTEARKWLVSLLSDPEERIRRYALAALPKLGGGDSEEPAIHRVLQNASTDREKQNVARVLEKVGGARTLALGEALPERALQRVRANVARSENPGKILLDVPFAPEDGPLHLHFRCRDGLETFLKEELADRSRFPQLRVAWSDPGCVAVTAPAPVTLGQLHEARCFSDVAVFLGIGRDVADIADQIVDGFSALQAWTEGIVRYRLEFVGRGHQRSVIRDLATAVSERSPGMLNDPREALWQIDLHDDENGVRIEAVPRLRPDPRFAWRLGDIPAASHPPLAAAMARLASPFKNEIVWDPFCGSGSELIEVALLGGDSIRRVVGTDVDSDALKVARRNLNASPAHTVNAVLAERDFRDRTAMPELRSGSVTLVISNPPMGRRVPIPDLAGLIDDLFRSAAAVLRPGGRLIFVNPVDHGAGQHPFELELRTRIDLGGFFVHLEKYVKTGPVAAERKPEHARPHPGEFAGSSSRRRRS